MNRTKLTGKCSRERARSLAIAYAAFLQANDRCEVAASDVANHNAVVVYGVMLERAQLETGVPLMDAKLLMRRIADAEQARKRLALTPIIS